MAPRKTKVMAEHLTEQEIEIYRRRDVTGKRQIIAAHLAVCNDCLKRVLDSEHSVVAFNALSEAFLTSTDEKPFHLSELELERYSTGATARADRIICESHLEICKQCSEELGVLTAGQAAPKPKSKRRSGIWSWQAWGVTPARVAVAIGLLGFLLLAVVLWRQRSWVTVHEESARNAPQETPLAPSPAPANEATPNSAEQVSPANQTIVASLKDNNREIRVDPEGKLTGMEGFDESSQRMVKAALSGEGLSKPNVLANISSPPIKLLGEPAGESTLQLIGPIGIVVTEQRPNLKWRELNGATSYVVSVFDNNFNSVAQSPPLTKLAWTIALPLQRGQTYSWEVTAVKEGKEITAPVAPAPRAQFRILEAEKLSALTKLKGQKPESHLALGLMYARLGLVTDAEREFRELVKENPDSALAKKLLRTVQAWR
jgi:hypothetical protein